MSDYLVGCGDAVSWSWVCSVGKHRVEMTGRFINNEFEELGRHPRREIH